MSLIRLFIDEDSMDQRFVNALESRGIDVITVGKARTIGFSDEEQLILATEQNRVLYTFNVSDFCQLHNQYFSKEKFMLGLLSLHRLILLGNKCGEYLN